MAVAELHSQAIAFPQRASRVATKSESAGYAAWLPLVAVLVGIASLFYLAQTSELTTASYNIQELRVEEGNWRLRNEQLALQLSQAKGLSVVEAQATGRLLMVPARDMVYLKAVPSDLASRPSPSARGESRGAPALVKAALSSADPLDPVRLSLSSFLDPDQHSLQR